MVSKQCCKHVNLIHFLWPWKVTIVGAVFTITDMTLNLWVKCWYIHSQSVVILRPFFYFLTTLHSRSSLEVTSAWTWRRRRRGQPEKVIGEISAREVLEAPAIRSEVPGGPWAVAASPRSPALEAEEVADPVRGDSLLHASKPPHSSNPRIFCLIPLPISSQPLLTQVKLFDMDPLFPTPPTPQLGHALSLSSVPETSPFYSWVSLSLSGSPVW